MDLGRIHTPKSASQILKISAQLHYHGNKRIFLEFVAKFVAKGAAGTSWRGTGGQWEIPFSPKSGKGRSHPLIWIQP